MPIEKLKQILETGEQDEVVSAIEELLTESITPEEQGQALIALASVYMELENTANRLYLELLKNAFEELKTLQKQHNKRVDEINLDQARKRLK